MNAADNGIIAAKKSINFTAEIGINYRPICFGKIGAQEQLFTVRQRLYDISV